MRDEWVEQKVIKALYEYGPMSDKCLDMLMYLPYGDSDASSKAIMLLALTGHIEKVEIWKITEKGKWLYKNPKMSITTPVEAQSASQWGLF